MTERNRGGQKGNQNAAKGPEGRLKVDVSLSGDRRAYIKQQALISLGHEPTEQDIIDETRKIFYAWLDERIANDR